MSKKYFLITLFACVLSFLVSPVYLHAEVCYSIDYNKPTIAGGGVHTVGLKEDGTVVAVGWNLFGETDVSSWMNIKAVAAGGWHTVGLKDDGTMVAVGWGSYGQTDVSSWTNIRAVVGGGVYTVGLKEDGTVVAVGWNGGYSQADVSSWTNIKAVAFSVSGGGHTVGLKEDGTVVAVGYNAYAQTDIWTDITAIAAGTWHTVGLKKNGTVVTTDGSTDVSLWTNIRQPACLDYASIASFLTVTKAGTGGGTVSSNPSGIICGTDCLEGYAAVGTVVTLTATPTSGSIFAGWSGDADCSDGVVTMDASKNCTAAFNLQTYTISVSKIGNGTVISSPSGINCGADCNETYDVGTVVNLTAAASTNYTFTGWSGACSGTGTCTMTIDANKSITAIFDQILPSTPSQSQGQGSGTNNQGISNAIGLQNAPGVQTAPGLQRR